MKNVAMIISPTSRGASEISRTVRATGLFQKVVHCATKQQTATALEQRIDIICYPYPHKASELSPLLLKLQERDEWHDIPLLLFTPRDPQNNRIKALELGASDCLPLDLSCREAGVQIGWHLKNKHRIELLRRSEANLAHKAVTDGLTGLFNRGYFDANLDQNLSLAHRTSRPLTLLLADLDHFKTINDTHGHLAGDRALQCFADLLKKSARRSDIVCRYGGEEFAVILPECDPDQAFLAAERFREKITRYDFGFPLTVSIGLAATTSNCRYSPTQLLEQADLALYSAKEKGRNRTETFPIPCIETLPTGIHLSHGSHAPSSNLPQILRRSISALRKVAWYSFS
ncbi:MAG: diguanylate cyclase [Desulfuromonadaceae bacterium]|nr:diguanylate cyclase [Desulfuromonadaceae bacterium]